MYHEPRGRWVWLLSFHKGGTESKVMPAHQPRGSRQSDLVESTSMTSSQFQVTLHSWATAWEGWQHTSRRIVLLLVHHHSQMVLIWWNLSGCFHIWMSYAGKCWGQALQTMNLLSRSIGVLCSEPQSWRHTLTLCRVNKSQLLLRGWEEMSVGGPRLATREVPSENPGVL